MKIGVRAVDLDRFVPDYRLHSQLRLPMELDERRFALGVDQAKGMDAETFHESKRAWYRAVRHGPHRHVNRFGRQRNEIPEVIVRGLRLRKAAVGFLFCSMDQVGELDRILDEKHR